LLNVKLVVHHVTGRLYKVNMFQVLLIAVVVLNDDNHTSVVDVDEMRQRLRNWRWV